MVFDEVKLHNKEFEDMDLLELYAERSARSWHRNQILHCRERLKKRQWWLEENMPIPTLEELQRQYENGEISKAQKQTSTARRKQAINMRMKNADRMNYAERVAIHEAAIVAYLDELIAEKLAKKYIPKKTPNRKYDPRKRRGKNNVPPPQLDPQRKWATRKEPSPFPSLRKARIRFRRGTANDKVPMMVMRKMQPIVSWDINKLMQVAKDRGYFSEVAVTAVISETLDITLTSTNRLIQSGRLSWGQCMIIGSVFEMTPKEFCDVFMAGYFKQVADGVFKASITEEELLALRQTPYVTRQGKGEETSE